MSTEISDRHVDVDGLRLHCLEAGPEAGGGDPVLLLHGWPTSSFLWRNVMPEIAKTHRVIALDLPGFGLSDKPLDASYSFRYFDHVLTGLLDALEIDRISLAVHDLGGPVGVYWASQNTERLSRLALLNTLLYPNPSWAVILFVLSIRIPGIRSYMASPRGLRFALRFGVTDPKKLSEEAIRGIQAPFESRDARRALLKTGCNLSPKGFEEIARWLPTVKVPVRGIYGERDRILPDIAKTMERVQKDIPHAQITSLPDCGHFLQEERPSEIGRQLAEFLSS